MLKGLVFVSLIVLSAFSATQCEKSRPLKKISYSASRVTYNDQCNGRIFKLYCPNGAQKCTIDVYGEDYDENYYITSYAIDHSECKKKRLFEQKRFAKFCKIHFTDNAKIVADEE